jgi:diamine N-acetyltransferase
MITYRDAIVADGPALAEMAAASFTETFGTLYTPADLTAFLRQTFGPEGLPADIGASGLKIRLALADERIVGFAKLARSSSLPEPATVADAELKQLYISKDWQGTDVAATLMAWALAEARAEGAARMVLSVYVDNLRAKRFYARYGFAEIGAAPFLVGDHIDDDRIWSLDL